MITYLWIAGISSTLFIVWRVVVALKSAKTEDNLEKYYEEESDFYIGKDVVFLPPRKRRD